MHDAMQHLLLMLCDAVVELDSDTRLKGKSKQPLKFIAKFPRFFFSQETDGKKQFPNMLHVWNIYLHLP